jgi:hypothetical protein
MNLIRKLLDPVVYDKSVRPALFHRDVTNVSFDLSLAQLIDVDEKNQIIKTNQWITMVEKYEKYFTKNLVFSYNRVGPIQNSDGIHQNGIMSVYFILNMIKFGYLILFYIM